MTQLPIRDLCEECREPILPTDVVVTTETNEGRYVSRHVYPKACDDERLVREHGLFAVFPVV